ncbi:MAG: hypothetical protein ISS69_06910 [Phycisphaerae bacterium]|nr:hypothetical protein [Phycisphaerae bacterium]
MVSRLAGLALVAVLDTVDVDQRNRHHLDVPTKPLAALGVGENSGQGALEHVTGHRFARVMAARQQCAVGGFSVDPADVDPLDEPPLASLA